MNTFQILEKLFRWTENFLDFLKVTFLSDLGKLFRQTFRQTSIPQITSFLEKFCTKQSYLAKYSYCKAVQKHKCTIKTIEGPSRIQNKALSQIKQCLLDHFPRFQHISPEKFSSISENFLVSAKTFYFLRKLFRFFKTDTLKSFPSTL